MHTMMDEIYDRNYQAARHTMNAGLAVLFDRFFAAAGNAFKVLHRIQFSAPWNARTRHVRCD